MGRSEARGIRVMALWPQSRGDTAYNKGLAHSKTHLSCLALHCWHEPALLTCHTTLSRGQIWVTLCRLSSPRLSQTRGGPTWALGLPAKTTYKSINGIYQKKSGCYWSNNPKATNIYVHLRLMTFQLILPVLSVIDLEA